MIEEFSNLSVIIFLLYNYFLEWPVEMVIQNVQIGFIFPQ